MTYGIMRIIREWLGLAPDVGTGCAPARASRWRVAAELGPPGLPVDREKAVAVRKLVAAGLFPGKVAKQLGIGQFETEIRAERQMDGIKKAKDRGIQFGKRPALTSKKIAELRGKRAKGTLIKDLMAEYSLSKATIYRYLTQNETWARF